MGTIIGDIVRAILAALFGAVGDAIERDKDRQTAHDAGVSDAAAAANKGAADAAKRAAEAQINIPEMDDFARKLANGELHI